ncbi:MAG: DUF4838 domain-containing protein [Planctomycetota bacterium]
MVLPRLRRREKIVGAPFTGARERRESARRLKPATTNGIFSHLLILVFAAAVCLAPLLLAQEKNEVAAGDYSVRLTERGFEIAHKGRPVTVGSYFSVCKPEYKGTLVSSSEGRKVGKASVSKDGRTLTLEATLPAGSFAYSATVSPNGVRVETRVALAKDAVVGPVEYAAFQMPTALIEGGSVEVFDAAGMVIDEKPIPAVPKRGGMARHGDGFIVKTAERSIIVSTASPMGLYPFDARVANYGDRQGLWAFTSIPVDPGRETVSAVELRVEPPAPAPAAGTITLAGGVPAKAVATAPNPTEREKLAADELVAYLTKISGKKLDRIEIADKTAPKGTIAVGRLAVEAGLVSQDELSPLKIDGYIVRVKDGRAAVCGWRDLGTVYAAYALLGRLGCKFYAPACEKVPAVKDPTIPECELKAWPIYEFRKVTQDLKLGHTPNDDLGNPAEIGEKGGLVHAAAFLVSYEKYGESHPEYFAMQKDGKRLHPDPQSKRDFGGDLHLCLSNPDVRRISAERLLDLIEKQKDRTFFGVSQGDGHAWCECDKCKALDHIPGRDMTDRLLDYVNYCAREVAKKYPDKRILTLAYTNATSPPPWRVTPEPNVMVQYCPYPMRTACQSHDLRCGKNESGFADLKGWVQACPNNMYIFDYPRGYKIWNEPFGSFYAMKRKLDFYAANGIRGLYYCGVPTNFQDLFVFVQSRLHWDPKADVEPLIDEFMAAYYGGAAPHVRAYFDFMHRQVEERQVHQMCEGANPGLATAEYVEKALEMFRKAEDAVKDDRTSLYRVRKEKSFVLFADLNERNPVNERLVVSREEFARRLAELMEIGRITKTSVVGRREDGIVGDWLFKIARIRTNVNPWYADPLVDRMIADPVKTLNEEERKYSQKPVEGGWLVELDGFRGCIGPKEYDYQCPARRAVWIYGKNTDHPAMAAKVHLDKVPPGEARLTLVGQDDDKPGAVEICITVNGKEVFKGANTFKEKGWSSADFSIPAGVLKAGENEIRIATLKGSQARDQGWFMAAECKMTFK